MIWDVSVSCVRGWRLFRNLLRLNLIVQVTVKLLTGQPSTKFSWRSLHKCCEFLFLFLRHKRRFASIFTACICIARRWDDFGSYLEWNFFKRLYIFLHTRLWLNFRISPRRSFACFSLFAQHESWRFNIVFSSFSLVVSLAKLGRSQNSLREFFPLGKKPWPMQGGEETLWGSQGSIFVGPPNSTM